MTTTTSTSGSVFSSSQISSLTASAGSTSPAVTSSSSSTASGAGSLGAQSLAGNFNEFLTLLTTQLQNQDPLSPMDTNQFTQQLVEFSSVEQQINMNQQMSTLISLQQTASSAQTAEFLGATVTVNGATAQLTNGTATWNYSVSSPATATINVTNSSGQTVFTQSGTVQPGQQQFTWNGIGTNGQQYPSGAYTIAVTATGANGQPVSVSTQVQGEVSAVDLNQNPPVLTVNGQNFTVSQILSVALPGSSSSTSG